MNITYHTMVGIASSSVIAKKYSTKDNKKDNYKILKVIIIGIIVNILLHGVLDLIPHNYPISLMNDIILVLCLSIFSIIFIKKKYRILTLSCICGSILPDIIDKFIVKIVLNSKNYLFPWHDSEVVNKFYKIYIKFISVEYYGLMNILITLIFLGVIIFYRKVFIRNFSSIINNEKGTM